MGRQSGILPIKGSVGNISFVKTQDGYLAKQKNPKTGDKIGARTRENNAEFGRAAKASKTLKNAFIKIMKGTADKRVTSRLNSWMMKIVQTDTVHARGERIIANGDFTLLEDFELNVHASLSNIMSASETFSFDRTQGSYQIEIPAFAPASYISAPRGSTHFQCCFGAALVDFVEEKSESQQFYSEMLALNDPETPVYSHQVTLTADSIQPFFGVMGIKFFQIINNQFYLLNNTAYNAMRMVKVNMV